MPAGCPGPVTRHVLRGHARIHGAVAEGVQRWTLAGRGRTFDRNQHGRRDGPQLRQTHGLRDPAERAHPHRHQPVDSWRARRARSRGSVSPRLTGEPVPRRGGVACCRRESRGARRPAQRRRRHRSWFDQHHGRRATRSADSELAPGAQCAPTRHARRQSSDVRRHAVCEGVLAGGPNHSPRGASGAST